MVIDVMHFGFAIASVFCLFLGTIAPAQNVPDPSPAVTKLLTFNALKGSVRLTHVRVIDGTGAPPLSDQTLLIRDGKIAEIRPTGSMDVPDGKVTFDMTGRSLLPGLVGMHNHLFRITRPSSTDVKPNTFPLLFSQMAYSAPRLYLAGGVTTMRTTGSMDVYGDLGLKRRIEANELPGPHLDVTGPYLTGAGNPFLQLDTLAGPEDARATVAFWAERGVTSFKAYIDITRAELQAVIEEAHARGLKVTGHLCSVTYPEAVALGIDNLEHGFEVNTQLDHNKRLDQCSDARGTETLEAMAPDSKEAASLIDLLVRHHVALTSTLAVSEAHLAGRPPLRQRQLDAMSPQARELALALRDARSREDAAVREQELHNFQREQQLERRFVAAGGLLLIGPDPTDEGVVPGFSDQRGLELLVDSGFTPLEAIRIATLNGAIYLGRQKTIGSIAVGKDADLLIVRGDPASAIGDIENVETVFRDGLGFDVDRLLSSAVGAYGLY